MTCGFYDKGWRRFEYDPILAEWVEHALPPARRALRDPEYARWWRHRNTWFVGVNALPNDDSGAVIGGPPLAGSAVDFARRSVTARTKWDRAQVSACFPGYPKRDESESEAAHHYRSRRAAAHVDGLLAEGPKRRRYLKELHTFILGIPLVECDQSASPFVVWERSHQLMREAFMNFYGGEPTQRWSQLDVTKVYHRARREAFADCQRVEIPAQPGEAFLVHRLALHGTAPWAAGATAGPDGRMIAFFRPATTDCIWWLEGR